MSKHIILPYLGFVCKVLCLSAMVLLSDCRNTAQTQMPASTKPKTPNFGQLPYHKILAYAYNKGNIADMKERPIERIIDRQGKLAANAVQPPVTLSPEQAKLLMKVLTEPNTYGQGGAKCFIPRMGFVLYDKNDVMLGQANICLECEWVRADPPIAYEQDGISPKGLKALAAKCRNLGLGDCGE